LLQRASLAGHSQKADYFFLEGNKGRTLLHVLMACLRKGIVNLESAIEIAGEAEPLMQA